MGPGNFEGTTNIADYRQAQAEVARAGNDKSSPLYQFAQQKLYLAQQGLLARLGIQRERMDLANRQFTIKNYGTDPTTGAQLTFNI